MIVLICRAKSSLEAGLWDPTLVRRSLQYYNTVCDMLTILLTGSSVAMDQVPTIPTEVPSMFAALPEWCLEDIADFVLMSMQ